jgi:aspartate aminotransferase
MTVSQNMFAQRIATIKPAATLALSARAGALKAQGRDIVNMGVGEPDFDTPALIRDAAKKAMDAGQTRYTPTAGTRALREAFAAKLDRENQLSYSSSEVMVTSGGKQAIHNAISVLVDRGDEVLIPAPYWVTYADVTWLCDGVPRFLETTIDTGFRITAAQLEAAITPRSKVLFLNSPGNPSGGMYDAPQLCAIGEVIRKHPQLWVISDDIYEHVLLGEKRMCNLLNVCPDLATRTILVNGVSKAYAMTGWRLGFAAASSNLIEAMETVQSQTTGSPNAISQAAAVVALTNSAALVEPMLRVYRDRHQLICGELAGIEGLRFIPSDGSFYVFAEVSQAIKMLAEQGVLKQASDTAFSEHLLDRYGLAVVPGSAFGASGHLRLSFATSNEQIRKACDRLRQACTSRIPSKEIV